MFTDIHLYRDILSPAKNLLVFQPDGIFCANAPRTLNDYLQYDWVGAPWSKTSDHGGNGGLSLRNVTRIIKVLEKEKRKIGDGALEDLWLTERLNRLPGAHMANATISKSFSVESVWDDTPVRCTTAHVLKSGFISWFPHSFEISPKTNQKQALIS